jgi:endonuclease/exonuclease/phosphatase family metal-dependent hydrolase
MVYGSIGTMLLYNKHINLYSTNTKIYLGLEIIIVTFNNQSQHAIHVIVIHKPFTLPLTHFFNALKQTMLILPQNCPTIVLGDFNVNMLDNINKSTQNLTQFMSQ